MTLPHTLNGAALYDALAAATGWLATNAAAVDALNVFPVPDGDTGTNMLLTMRAAVSEADASDKADASSIAAAAAHGALIGARGNSGVILSQILRGFNEGLAGAQEIDGPRPAEALAHAADRAYAAVATPVEGTILSVIRAAADGARSSTDASALATLHAATDAAKSALARTPEQLPVLKQAGVVDSGGQGLVLLLEGMLAQLQGKPLTQPYATLGAIRSGWLAEVASQHRAGEDSAWGYCTEFLMRPNGVTEDSLRDLITPLGSSLLVVGDGDALHVHVHAADPGAVLSVATAHGTLHNIKIENMQDQQGALIERAALPAATVGLPVIAVVAGDGLAEVFLSMGAAAIVPGGQSMNPSAGEIAAAVDVQAADTVVVLPNNGNVILSCQQAEQLTTKSIVVIPTRTIPQGIAALLAVNPEAIAEENIAAMISSAAAVRTIELTIATRDVNIDGLDVHIGEFVGLLDDKLVAVSPDLLAAFNAALDLSETPRGALVTLYYGQDVSEGDAQGVALALRGRPEAPEVDVVRGGQAHYHFIASVEA